VTISEIVVLALTEPEVPVIVMAFVPVATVELALRVSTLAPVAGFVPNDAVTPLGRPDATRVTLPVNPPEGVTVIVSVPLAPWVTETVDAEGARVKPEFAPPTFSVTVVLAVVLPEVPVIVMVDAPTAAVLAADRVSTLVVLLGFVPNDALTPLGRPEAASVTPPVNPPTSVTVIVSVALLPCVTDRVAADGANVKPAGVLVNVPMMMPRPLVPR
jgi:hypothetical protein